MSPTPAWVSDVIATCPPMMTYSDVGDVLQVSPRTVRRLIATGSLTAVRSTFSGSSGVRIPRAELGRYLASLGAA